MIINQLSLHRFKQFKSTDIHLSPDLSLLVGGNNAGKSSILHALAVWEFCKTILEFSKGRKAWAIGGGGQGIGVALSEFSPISVPSLRHLWTNLQSQRLDEDDGYTLKVRVGWTLADDTAKHLEFGLSLANDRLFIKTTDTNLEIAEVQGIDGGPLPGNVPRVAYLPPFAGITDKESRHSLAVRNRLIGQGLSGGVIRNVLYDMYQQSRKERLRLRGNKSKISSADLAAFRKTDPWELLLKALAELFQVGLVIEEFDDRYHTNLRVETRRLKLVNLNYVNLPNDYARDLMVEGSGFLQWLSVYALALSPDLDVLLLDEPDAHLHCSLQLELVGHLSKIAREKKKQILMASHSTDLIKSFNHHQILQVKAASAKYLNIEDQKIAVLAGIGATFSPKLHALTELRKMLIIEGSFDEDILKIWATVLGIAWPPNIVIWNWPGGHKERRQLFTQLKNQIPDLRAISLRDRDDEADGTVTDTLVDKSQSATTDGFLAYKWRRRHAENYLLNTTSIARASGRTEVEVDAFFAARGINIPPNVTASAVAMAIRDARGKELFEDISVAFNITRHDVAKAMLPQEVADDVRKMVEIIVGLSLPIPPPLPQPIHAPHVDV